MFVRCVVLLVSAAVFPAISLLAAVPAATSSSRFSVGSCDDGARFHVLVFSRALNYRHASIPAGLQALQDLGREHCFGVEATEEPAAFTDETLGGYDAVVFLNTSGDVLETSHEEALRRFVENGGGWVGIHGAAATEYDWPWYGELVGGVFDDHPELQTATVEVGDRVFPATAHLPHRWQRFDEWYNFRGNPRGDVHVLMALDEASYEGGTMGHDHPIAWAQPVGTGRSFYTGLGHTEEGYSEPLFLEHLLGGIEWAAGAVEGDAAATLPSNFRTVVLEDDVTDVMELDVAADGRVFWIERQGPLRVWDPATDRSHLAGTVPSWMVIEDGASGLALDPHFLENGWVYVYYTPATGEPNRIARFTYHEGRLDLASEKVILEVPVQRDYCCHSAGYLLFDDEGNLWLSTGDNTHNIIDGGAPIDEVPGEQFSDAQRSSANTNDLRGKVLRIRPLPDGTYEIPEGNLFADDDDPRTRPEIYTMGHRNPWRFSIDPKTGWLYVGDVGLGNPPGEKGPWGWEEINRAKEPAFFGWPYLAGPNEAYADIDVATGEIGERFDPDRLVNDSPNNTGLRELPPADSAFIWYTYGPSEDFPALGAGGMSAAAGPVYRRPASAGPDALPPYYDGAFLFYEWMRNWIMEVQMDDAGEILQINPFLPGRHFSRPIDVKVGPDGALYIAEWGEEFWGSNSDARIIRLEYHGAEGAQAEAEQSPASTASVSNNAPSVTSRLSFAWPPDGGFVAYDRPFEFRLDESPNGARVHVLTGHDTHAHPVDTLYSPEGVVEIARSAHQHTPDLHLSDRFIELQVFAGDSAGPGADVEEPSSDVKGPAAVPDASVRLNPMQLEAEHTFDRTADRRSIGGHPAGKGYAETVIVALVGGDGDWAAYDPVNLFGIDSLTIRAKPLAEARIEVRMDSLSGPLLAEVVLDSVTTESLPVAESRQRRQFNEMFDQAMDSVTEAYDPDAAVYEGWYDVAVPLDRVTVAGDDATVPLDDSGRTHKLVFVFRGDDSGSLIQLDWMRFGGAGIHAGPLR